MVRFLDPRSAYPSNAIRFLAVCLRRIEPICVRHDPNPRQDRTHYYASIHRRGSPTHLLESYLANGSSERHLASGSYGQKKPERGIRWHIHHRGANLLWIHHGLRN
jgi:hypothetical protein